MKSVILDGQKFDQAIQDKVIGKELILQRCRHFPKLAKEHHLLGIESYMSSDVFSYYVNGKLELFENENKTSGNIHYMRIFKIIKQQSHAILEKI